MKLLKLALTNFRSHAQTHFPLNRTNLVRGRNGGGKSSLAMGLEFVLTGRVLRDDSGRPITDEGGRGADRLIRRGAKEARVSVGLELEDGSYTVTRIRSLGGVGTLLIENEKGRILTGRDAEHWLTEKIGPPEVLSVLVNDQRFLRLSDKEQRALFAAALPSTRVDVPADLLKFLKTGGSPRLPAAIESQREADQFYEWAYETRAQVNREIKAMGAIEAPPESDLPFLEEVDEGLRKLGAERDQLIRQREQILTKAEADRTSGAIKRRAELENEKLKLLTQAREQGARLEVARESLAEASTKLLNDDQIEELRTAVTHRRKWMDLEKRINVNQDRVHSLRQELQQMGGREPAVCPTCKRPFEAKDQTADIARVKQTLEEAESALGKDQIAIRKLSDPLEAERRLDAHKAAMTEALKAEKIISELSQEPNPRLTKIELELAAPEEPPSLFPPTDTSDVDQQLAKVEDRIHNGNQLRIKVAMVEGQQKQYQASVGRRGELDEKSEALDWVVKYFSEGGPLRTQLVGNRFEDFRRQLLAGLSEFGGFDCTISLDPYQFTVNGSPLNCLCETEAFRFSIALQVALAKATGLGVAVVDRSDQLLPELRPEMHAVLEGLEQAIVLAASSMPEIGEPPVGTSVFDLEKRSLGDGPITIISAVHTAASKEQEYEFAEER